MTHADYIYAAAQASLASGTFLWESPVQAGQSLDSVPVPAIVLGDYTTTTVGQSSNVVTALLTLYFADAKPGQGDDAEAHHDAVSRMEALRRKFFQALDLNPLVQITGIRATPFADAYASKLDGIGVQFTLAIPLLSDCEPVEAVRAGYPYVFDFVYGA